MTDSTSVKPDRPKRSLTGRLSTTKRGPDITEFKAWLAGLETAAVPSVHVNGAHFPAAILTVDFGTPLEQTKLKPEVQSELVARMRKASKDIINKDLNIRVSFDTPNGVWWTSIG